MPHDFSVDKKTGIILVTVCSLTGILLFLAGFLTGVQYQFSIKAPDLMAKSSPTKVEQAKLKSPAARPASKEPETAAASASTPASRTQTPSTPPAGDGASAEAAAQTPSQAPAGQAVASASAAPNEPKTTPQAAGSSTSGPPAINQSASASAQPAADNQSAASHDEEKYSIQIGAFLNPKNATGLMKDLQQKGYKASEFVATDSKYRVWHTVRIGPFNSIQTASQQARLFSENAHLMALVRPADSL